MGDSQQSVWDAAFIAVIAIAIAVNLAQMLSITNAGFRDIPLFVVEKVSILSLWVTLARYSLAFQSFLIVSVSVSLVAIYVMLGHAHSDEIAGVCALAIACSFWGCVVRSVLMCFEENEERSRYGLRGVAVSLILVSIGLAIISNIFARANYDISSMLVHVALDWKIYTTAPAVSIVIAIAALQRHTRVFVLMFIGLLCVLFLCMLLMQFTGFHQYSIAAVGAIGGVVVLDSALLRLALLTGRPKVEQG